MSTGEVVAWTPLIGDYGRFHELAVGTGDVDPVYPVLIGVARNLDLTADQAAWLALLHVAFYDLGSALLAYAATGGRPRPLPPRGLHLPCGTERRGNRDPRQLAAHLDSLTARCEGYGGAAHWLAAACTDGVDPGGGRRLSYLAAFNGVQQVRGNGRWAAYKTCELLSHVLRGYDPAWTHIEPTDMGHAYSTGPRQGLALLTAIPPGNSVRAVARLDRLSARLVDLLHGRGLAATAATAETTLCDFHALTAGRYYVGHDIDQMCAQLRRAADNAVRFADGDLALAARCNDILTAAWDARATVFPHAYLGERATPQRWGIDKTRTAVYRASGQILARTPSDKGTDDDPTPAGPAGAAATGS